MGPLLNGLFMAYKGWLLFTYKSWDDPRSTGDSGKMEHLTSRVSHQKKPSDFSIVHGCLLEILVGYSNPLYPYRQQIISFFFIAHVKRITYPLCHSWVGTSPIINPSEKECDIIKILSSFPTWICFLGGWKASKNIPQMVMAHIVIYHGFESPKKSTNFSQIQVRPAIFVSSVQVT